MKSTVLAQSERDTAAKVLRAMGHSVRLGTLDALRDGPLTVSELHRHLGCSPSTMSQQLQILENHGLVGSTRQGTHKLCHLRNRDVLEMLECLRRHLHTYLSSGRIGPVWTSPETEDSE